MNEEIKILIRKIELKSQYRKMLAEESSKTHNEILIMCEKIAEIIGKELLKDDDQKEN
jgi:hypothetical protein